MLILKGGEIKGQVNAFKIEARRVVIILEAAGQAALRDPMASEALRILAEVYIIVVALLALNSVLNVCERIYRRFPVSREIPIKGFLQVLKILIFAAGEGALPAEQQKWIFLTLLIGFGILVSLFPFHTWAPPAYSAPTERGSDTQVEAILKKPAETKPNN